MTASDILEIILCIVITNIIGMVIGPIIDKLDYFFNTAKIDEDEHGRKCKQHWNVVTLIPKLAFGLFKPILFGIGMFLRKKALSKETDKAKMYLIYLGVLVGIAAILYVVIWIAFGFMPFASVQQ